METSAESVRQERWRAGCSHGPHGASPLVLHQQKSTSILLSLMQWWGPYLGWLRDLKSCHSSQRIPGMGSKQGCFFFLKNSLHLLTFYCNKAGFYPEELLKLSRCHVNYMVVSMVQTDYEGSKNHTQTSSGVNWHHPIEFADCTVYSQDANSWQHRRYIPSSAKFIYPFISI